MITARLRKKVDNSIEAAWIPDSDEEDEEDGEDGEDEDDEMMEDDEPKSFDVGHGNNNNAGENKKTVRFDRTAFDEAVVQDDQSEGEEYEDIEPQQSAKKHKRDDEEFDLDFPDEVDVPLGVNARDRFQK
jgi:pre-rRNA-processing protein TSR1